MKSKMKTTIQFRISFGIWKFMLITGHWVNVNFVFLSFYVVYNVHLGIAIAVVHHDFLSKENEGDEEE